MNNNLWYPLYFLLRTVAKLLVLPLSSGIDLESMSVAQRDALLVFRTLCKVDSLSLSLSNANIVVHFLWMPLIVHTLNLADGNEGR
jgi:hypothetical protein